MDETNEAFRAGFREGARAMVARIATLATMKGNIALATEILQVRIPEPQLPERMDIGSRDIDRAGTDPPTEPIPRPQYQRGQVVEVDMLGHWVPVEVRDTSWSHDKGVHYTLTCPQLNMTFKDILEEKLRPVA